MSNLLISTDKAVTSKNIAGMGIVVPNAEEPEVMKYKFKAKAANRKIEIGAITVIDKIHLFEVVRAQVKRVENSAIE